jgi:UPF0755 protein
VSRRASRILVGAGAVVLLAVTWFALQVYPLGGHGRLVVVTVHSGDSIATIAGEMHAKGVIASPFAFRIDTQLFGTLKVRAGTYVIYQNSSFSEVRRIFGALPNVIPVTPGMTEHEVALSVAERFGNTYAERFLTDLAALARTSPYHPDLTPPALSGQSANVNSFEGLIGVGLYPVAPGESASALAAKMAQGFVSEARSVGFSPSTTINGLNAYRLLIAASIVEREGYYPQNMPKVARVIFNRLRRGGGLQMDSTIKYPLGLDSGAVTTQMLTINSPYNTYLSAGLTPTPICTVSTTALRAVLHAPPGPWLYFVLIDQKGDLAFAATYAQQLRNEKKAAKVFG